MQVAERLPGGIASARRPGVAPERILEQPVAHLLDRLLEIALRDGQHPDLAQHGARTLKNIAGCRFFFQRWPVSVTLVPSTFSTDRSPSRKLPT